MSTPQKIIFYPTMSAIMLLLLTWIVFYPNYFNEDAQMHSDARKRETYERTVFYE